MKQLDMARFMKACKDDHGIDLSRYCFPLEKNGFPNQPVEKYVHLVVLQEFNSYAVITQDGEHALVALTRETPTSDKMVGRLVEFKRKNVAGLRRKSKSLLRTHAPASVRLISTSDKKEDDVNENTCGMLTMCRQCADDSLFGFAVGEDGSVNKVAFNQTSRVKTDSGFSIRPIGKEITAKIIENAQSDEDRMGSPTRAFFNKEHVLPEVVIPMVITLQNPTIEDIVYMSYLITKTSRAGAVSTRGGTIMNHVVGTWFSNEEFVSNKLLSQSLYDVLGKPEELPAIMKLRSITIDTIGRLMKGLNIHGEFLPWNAIENELRVTFDSEESIARWIGDYGNNYRELLVELDATVVNP